MSQDIRQSQVARWCFTLNNFDEALNYKQHISQVKFKVKRGVWGKEIAPETGTPHLQGYLEFFRSVRFAHVQHIFGIAAHWEVARSSSLVNYNYCCKDGDYESFGDFSQEERGEVGGVNERRRSASIPMVIRGLLSSDCAIQIKVSKEYADRNIYFDRVTNILKTLIDQHRMFNKWQNKLLYPWQFEILDKVLTQGDRKIIWVVDRQGNNGKTYLSFYLTILYFFQYLDGSVNGRDLGSILRTTSKGIVFDVSRAGLNSFDYGVVENLKNGVLVSGKYRGAYKNFNPMKIVVFSNNFPNNSLLSEDRWDTVILGEGNYTQLDKSAIIAPQNKYPFIEPPALPELSETFDLREFLESRISDDNGLLEIEQLQSFLPQNIISNHGSRLRARLRKDIVATSQVAGPSRTNRDVSSQNSQNTDNFVPDPTAVKVLQCPNHTHISVRGKGCPCRTKNKTRLPSSGSNDGVLAIGTHIEDESHQGSQIDNTGGILLSSVPTSSSAPGTSRGGTSGTSLSSSDELPCAQPQKIIRKRKQPGKTKLSLSGEKSKDTGTQEKDQDDISEDDFVNAPKRRFRS